MPSTGPPVSNLLCHLHTDESVTAQQRPCWPAGHRRPYETSYLQKKTVDNGAAPASSSHVAVDAAGIQACSCTVRPARGAARRAAVAGQGALLGRRHKPAAARRLACVAAMHGYLTLPLMSEAAGQAHSGRNTLLACDKQSTHTASALVHLYVR